jgi:hypothetical protein
MGDEIFTHTVGVPPVYQLFIYGRPSSKGKGKQSYMDKVRAEARRRIDKMIETDDVELSILYSSRRPQMIRADVDNILKPTLDALCGLAYRDDRQVRAVSTRLIDRTRPVLLRIGLSLGHTLINSIFLSDEEDIIIIHVYSEWRLKEEGPEAAEQRVVAEARQETDRLLALRGGVISVKEP